MIDRMPVLVDWVVRFALHVATGVLAVAVHYSLMAVLLRAGTQPVLASSLGFVAGAVTRFLTAYFKVYAPTGTMRAAMTRFLLALGTQFFLNSVLLAGMLEMRMSVWRAQVLTTVLLTFGNYLVYRLWVFR
ncbi:GtrA family protein [Chromohalobacter sp.]|uniref:GtrA family protein n=1 Tax=Chromohalobacter sp. TaxID=50740 RepID=UPI0025850FB8|nr:GtrA family protein [Chromohalobacter sp.]MCI0594528.1 GtrA family protein [Chromohalobacter sp.]